MGLSSALSAGVSGIQRHQLKLDVIGNDIANVNTYGYKEQRVIFQDVLYNTLSSGTAPAGTNAGTNPSQVGGGVDLAAIQTNFNDGDIETTGIMSDMAIEGKGFFVLKDGISEVYTRDGAFTLNQERKLVNGGSGMVVQGWVQSRDNAGNSTVNTGGAIEDIVIPVGDNRIAKATSKVVMNGNLNNAGDIGTTGTILNSQRLFSSSSGDVEVGSGSHDLREVYIKDPAGGVDNVRLFSGSSSDTSGNNILGSGDQVTVQITKGGRPLEAIFVYGDGDTINNTTGLKGQDGVADAGQESYDGKTLNDFLVWFDKAFGIYASEDIGSGAVTNAAHGVDGDNPNDLIDMKDNAGLPFNDETDNKGFELLLSSKVKTLAGVTTATGSGPQAVIAGSSASVSPYDIKAGSSADVGTGNSYVDMDADNAFNVEKDIVLKDAISYVVTGNSTVSAGGMPLAATNSSTQIVLRSMVTDPLEQQAIANNTDMYIDLDGTAGFQAGSDVVIKGAFSNNVFGASTITAGAVADVSGKATITFTSATDNNSLLTSTSVTKGMSIFQGTVRYFVESVDTSSSTQTVVTLDRANSTVAGSILAAGGITFMGGALVQAGFTATSSSGVGSTLVSNLTTPIATKDSSSKFQGRSFYSSVADNEKTSAGSIFTGGDITARVSADPETIVLAAAAADVNGRLTMTVDANDGLVAGMSIVGDVSGTKYIIDEVNGTTVSLNQAQASTDFAAGTYIVNGKAYLDADNSGTISETVFHVRNSKSNTVGATTGSLFIDTNRLGVYTAGATNVLEVKTLSSVTDLSSYSDNEVVHTDTSTGNIYRKVPTQYDSTNSSVYLDKLNKGTYDEVEFDLVKMKTSADSVDNVWVLDEDRDGVADASDNTVVSLKDIISTDFASQSAKIEAASAVSLNGIETGSGRLQIRGNIGTSNELSGISFISGASKVERNLFSQSSLADTSGSGFSIQKSADGESINQNIVVYDSLGKSHDVSITFILESKDNDKAEWRWYAETGDASSAGGPFPVGDPRGNNPAINVGTGIVQFDNFGRYLSSDPTTPLISIPLEGQDTDSALKITPDFSILTAFAESSGSQVDVRDQDGFAQGVMERYSVGADGAVTGIYSNGMREVVAKVALAAFANPDGLVRNGANTFSVGSNSGNAMVGEAGTGERGTVKGEALELSNVDITKEFTEMITTQRAYQANARVITKSDELLQELMQIIR